MRRTFFERALWSLAVAVLPVALAAVPVSKASADNREQLRIGFQKYWTLIILKARGTLEQRLKALDIDVSWTEFVSGPPMFEALNVGSIDFATVGDAPPIFAQAAGAKFVYVANEPPRRPAKRSSCRRTRPSSRSRTSREERLR